MKLLPTLFFFTSLIPMLSSSAFRLDTEPQHDYDNSLPSPDVKPFVSIPSYSDPSNESCLLNLSGQTVDLGAVLASTNNAHMLDLAKWCSNAEFLYHILKIVDPALDQHLQAFVVNSADVVKTRVNQAVQQINHLSHVIADKTEQFNAQQLQQRPNDKQATIKNLFNAIRHPNFKLNLHKLDPLQLFDKHNNDKKQDVSHSFNNNNIDSQLSDDNDELNDDQLLEEDLSVDDDNSTLDDDSNSSSAKWSAEEYDSDDAESRLDTIISELEAADPKKADTSKSEKTKTTAKKDDSKKVAALKVDSSKAEQEDGNDDDGDGDSADSAEDGGNENNDDADDAADDGDDSIDGSDDSDGGDNTIDDKKNDTKTGKKADQKQNPDDKKDDRKDTSIVASKVGAQSTHQQNDTHHIITTQQLVAAKNETHAVLSSSTTTTTIPKSPNQQPTEKTETKHTIIPLTDKKVDGKKDDAKNDDKTAKEAVKEDDQPDNPVKNPKKADNQDDDSEDGTDDTKSKRNRKQEDSDDSDDSSDDNDDSGSDNEVDEDELKQHQSPGSCWMKLNGQVIDLSKALRLFPVLNGLTSACGMAEMGYKALKLVDPNLDKQLKKFSVGALKGAMKGGVATGHAVRGGLHYGKQTMVNSGHAVKSLFGRFKHHHHKHQQNDANAEAESILSAESLANGDWVESADVNDAYNFADKVDSLQGRLYLAGQIDDDDNTSSKDTNQDKSINNNLEQQDSSDQSVQDDHDEQDDSYDEQDDDINSQQDQDDEDSDVEQGSDDATDNDRNVNVDELATELINVFSNKDETQHNATTAQPAPVKTPTPIATPTTPTPTSIVPANKAIDSTPKPPTPKQPSQPEQVKRSTQKPSTRRQQQPAKPPSPTKQQKAQQPQPQPKQAKQQNQQKQQQQQVNYSASIGDKPVASPLEAAPVDSAIDRCTGSRLHCFFQAIQLWFHRTIGEISHLYFFIGMLVAVCIIVSAYIVMYVLKQRALNKRLESLVQSSEETAALV